MVSYKKGKGLTWLWFKKLIFSEFFLQPDLIDPYTFILSPSDSARFQYACPEGRENTIEVQTE